jgi:predicted  nucleic acid-binding Zn ribbon protein
MINIEVVFRYCGKPDEAAVSGAVNTLLGAWIQNGQVVEGDCPITFARTACRMVVGCPESTSLNTRYANKWVRRAISEISRQGLHHPGLRVLGREIESRDADLCRRPPWLIMSTHFLSRESPLICGEHYLPVPLYRIPRTDTDNGYDVRCWQVTWSAFDRLQMLCGPGKRFAARQISDLRSRLSSAGRKLGRGIEKSWKIPTYYYLYRNGGRSLACERRRACPSCGGKWLLDEPLHGVIDFKCDRCRLISNISWEFRRD